MILPLFAVAQQPQVGLGAAEMILDAAAEPIIIGVRVAAVAHDGGNCLKRFGEWFHTELFRREQGSLPFVSGLCPHPHDNLPES